MDKQDINVGGYVNSPSFNGAYPGMSMRQYYAGLALQAIIQFALAEDWDPAIVANGAVDFADALIERLEEDHDSE